MKGIARAYNSKPDRLEYPFRLNLYLVSPSEEISIDEMESLAVERLSILKAIESCTIRSLREDELALHIRKISDRHLPLHSNDASAGFSLNEERRKDFLSHFILRLAFSKTEESRRWFINFECLLFKIRFNGESLREKEEFMRFNRLDYELVSPQLKSSLKLELLSSSPTIDVDNESFFLVPFEEVPDLVAKRCVFISKGDAFVPQSESLSMILMKFRINLEKQLTALSKKISSLSQDDRLLPLLNNLTNIDPGSEQVNSVEGKLTAAQIPAASAHFPLCMMHLTKQLQNEAHLRYNGRQQIGLFLKSIGLPLEEAIVFWRRMFGSKHNEESFNKNYLYNIRHNYGQEGKRANYAPYSCHKIITTNAPSTGEHHGCPFRHFGSESLSSTLSLYKSPIGLSLSSSGHQEVMDLVKSGHYQIACTRLFELSRSSPHNETIVYPNEFYQRSTQLQSVK